MSSELSRLEARVCKHYPCREKIINDLYGLVGNADESLPDGIHVFGHTGTGKTSVINAYFIRSNFNYVYINLIECYVSKILFEKIINKFYKHEINAENNFLSYAKCENLYEFINLLRKLDINKSYIICLDNAERIRDMEMNILLGFLRLQEFTGLNICTILISQLPFEKFYPICGVPDIHVIHCPQYTKTEVQKILSMNFQKIKEYVKSKLIMTTSPQKSDAIKTNESDDGKDKKNKLEIIENLQDDFYQNYLNLFLNVFHRICKDLPELKMISKDCFVQYCEPVVNETINCNDVSKLWRHITKPLRNALSGIYMRIDQPDEQEDFSHGMKKLAQSLELPYYAKYLLIAAFLASYNSPKDDKRLFVKNHGKQRKRMQTVNANAKTSDKMATFIGPKSFTIDRLLAIFYSILDEKCGLTCNLLSQISTLVNLKLLIYVSGEANIMDGSARLQCTVNLDFILNLGQILGLNVRQYLSDFK